MEEFEGGGGSGRLGFPLGRKTLAAWYQVPNAVQSIVNMANLAFKQTKLRNASHTISKPSQNHPCYSTYSSLTHSPHTSLSQTQTHTIPPRIKPSHSVPPSQLPPTHPPFIAIGKSQLIGGAEGLQSKCLFVAESKRPSRNSWGLFGLGQG